MQTDPHGNMCCCNWIKRLYISLTTTKRTATNNDQCVAPNNEPPTELNTDLLGLCFDNPLNATNQRSTDDILILDNTPEFAHKWSNTNITWHDSKSPYDYCDILDKL